MQTDGPVTSAQPPQQILTFSAYEDVQRAVDHLADRGFPVAALSIIWGDLRRVEQVTGRRTTWRAFGEGALTGTWFGLLLGLLLVILVDFEGGAGDLWVVVWYVVGAALAAGLISAFMHGLQRGRRDFGTVGYLDAARFELWCRAEVADRARDELEVRTRRPMDPPATPPATARAEPR